MLTRLQHADDTVGKTIAGIYCNQNCVIMSFTDGTFVNLETAMELPIASEELSVNADGPAPSALVRLGICTQEEVIEMINSYRRTLEIENETRERQLLKRLKEKYENT